MRAQAVRDMSLAAENVVILTESNKFSAAGTVPLNIKNDSKMIITDNNLPDELIEYFNNESDFTKLIITD